MFRIVIAIIFLGAVLLRAQSPSQIWFVMWNGQPTPSGDVSVQKITANGTGSAVATGAAANFLSQTNFSSFNSPYAIAVDTTMGKIYVLDNNLPSSSPANQCIYSFNLAGTPAQIAASAQIIYAMQTPQADTNSANPLYPLISGMALDSANHYLYFNQMDSVTSSNAYIGRLDLSSSSFSDAYSVSNNSPTLQTFYTGQIPGQGPIAIDSSNIYVGALNGNNGNDGVYVAPLSGAGSFSELVAISSGNVTFTNGFIAGVASFPQSNLVYYLTFNAGYLNYNFNTNQNAIWSYNTVSHVKTLIAAGYQGYPNNIALDTANGRYYFTVGRDGTEYPPQINSQAIYTGTIGSTNAPTLFYTPSLSGFDTSTNPGNVAIQGIYIVDLPTNNLLPLVAGSCSVNAEKNWTLNLPLASVLANGFDPNGYFLSVTAVNSASTNGGSVSLGGSFINYTPVSNFIGKDQITYTLADTVGVQTQGTVAVNVLALNPPLTNTVQLAVSPGDSFLLYVGAANQSYVVQYANSAAGPWFDLSPVLTAGGAGAIQFNDFSPFSSSARFYRVRKGP